MFRRVCAGVNFNAESPAVVGSAANLARCFGLSVDLLSVVRSPGVYRHVATPAAQASVESAVAKARAELESLRNSSGLASLAVTCHVRVGHPFGELIAGALETGAGLLIVGNRIPGRVEQAVLTTTVQRLLRVAPMPVLVVRTVLAAAPKTILATTDFSPDSCRAVEQAVVLARAWQARLVLLHVLEPLAEPYVWPLDPPTVSIYMAEPEQMEPEWRALLEKFDLSGLEWEKHTVKGHATEKVVAAVGQHSPDLLVIGTAGHGAVAHFFLGSVAENLLRLVSCPVLCARGASSVFSPH